MCEYSPPCFASLNHCRYKPLQYFPLSEFLHRFYHTKYCLANIHAVIDVGNVSVVTVVTVVTIVLWTFVFSTTGSGLTASRPLENTS